MENHPCFYERHMSVAMLNCQRVLPVNQHGIDPENCQRVLPNTYFAGYVGWRDGHIFKANIESPEEQFIQYIWNQKLREVGKSKRYQKNA